MKRKTPLRTPQSRILCVRVFAYGVFERDYYGYGAYCRYCARPTAVRRSKATRHDTRYSKRRGNGSRAPAPEEGYYCEEPSKRRRRVRERVERALLRQKRRDQLTDGVGRRHRLPLSASFCSSHPINYDGTLSLRGKRIRARARALRTNFRLLDVRRIRPSEGSLECDGMRITHDGNGLIA